MKGRSCKELKPEGKRVLATPGRKSVACGYHSAFSRQLVVIIRRQSIRNTITFFLSPSASLHLSRRSNVIHLFYSFTPTHQPPNQKVHIHKHSLPMSHTCTITGQDHTKTNRKRTNKTKYTRKRKSADKGASEKGGVVRDKNYRSKQHMGNRGARKR